VKDTEESVTKIAKLLTISNDDELLLKTCCKKAKQACQSLCEGYNSSLGMSNVGSGKGKCGWQKD
jgi:hypothetical protein